MTSRWSRFSWVSSKSLLVVIIILVLGAGQNLQYKDTVYGKRDGAITGLAIVHKDRRNYFLSSKGYKTGVIHQVPMCSRSAMFKPEQAPNLSWVAKLVGNVCFQPHDIWNHGSRSYSERENTGYPRNKEPYDKDWLNLDLKCIILYSHAKKQKT